MHCNNTRVATQQLFLCLSHYCCSTLWLLTNLVSSDSGQGLITSPSSYCAVVHFFLSLKLVALSTWNSTSHLSQPFSSCPYEWQHSALISKVELNNSEGPLCLCVCTLLQAVQLCRCCVTGIQCCWVYITYVALCPWFNFSGWDICVSALLLSTAHIWISNTSSWGKARGLCSPPAMPWFHLRSLVSYITLKWALCFYPQGHWI